MPIIMYVSGGATDIKSSGGNMQVIPFPQGQQPPEKGKVPIRDKHFDKDELEKLDKIARETKEKEKETGPKDKVR